MNSEQIIRPRQWWSLAFTIAITLHFVAKLGRHGWDGTFYAAIGVVAIAGCVYGILLNLRYPVVGGASGNLRSRKNHLCRPVGQPSQSS